MTTFGGTAFNRMCAGSAIASPFSVANQSRPSRPRSRRAGRCCTPTLRMPLAVVNLTRMEIRPRPSRPPRASSRADAEDPVVARQPEVAAVVGQDFLDGVMKEPGGLAVRREPPLAPPRQSSPRAEPERAALILQDGHYDVVREAVPGRPVGELPVAQPADSAAERPGPDRSGPVLVQRKDAVGASPSRSVYASNLPPR